MELLDAKVLTFSKGKDLAVDFDDHFIFTWRPSTDEKLRLLVVEPFTWAWVAITICEGVLAAIGAKLFNDMFGTGKIDFAAFQRDLIIAIRQVIREVILEDDLRKVEAQLRSLNTLFQIYANSPSASLLETLLIKANDIVEEADSLGVPAIASFAIDGSLELLILQEKFKQSNYAGDKLNTSLVADKLINRIPSFTKRLEQWNQSRFSEIYLGPTRRGPLDFGLVYNLDGVVVPPSGEPNQQRNLHIERERRRLEKEILSPLYAVGNKWAEIRESSSQ